MWPLAVIAASMLAQHMATSDAQDRQKGLQRSMQAYQRSKAQQTEQAINQLVDKQTPDARAKELQDIDTSRQASMQGTVDQARAASPVTAAAGTNTSADYQKASGAAADTIANRTKRAIQQLGLMGAPGEQGVASSIRFGRAAGSVDAGNQAISNVGRGYMTDIDNVQPDPFLMLASKAGMGVGMGMATGGLGAEESNLISPKNADWGGLDAGPGAYNANANPSLRARLSGALTSMKNWGN